MKSVKLVTFDWLKIIYGIIGATSGILILRFILKMFFVESSNPVAGLIYFLTGWLVTPVQRLLRINDPLPGAVFETYTLVTLLVIGVGGLIVATAVTAWKKKFIKRREVDNAQK
jgi:ABC-type antimicrobial peptide transport system permease subunit